MDIFTVFSFFCSISSVYSLLHYRRLCVIKLVRRKHVYCNITRITYISLPQASSAI